MADTTGVPLKQSEEAHWRYMALGTTQEGRTHIAHTVAVAEARERVVEAARAHKESLVSIRGVELTGEATLRIHETKEELWAALAALDALEGRAT